MNPKELQEAKDQGRQVLTPLGYGVVDQIIDPVNSWVIVEDKRYGFANDEIWPALDFPTPESLVGYLYVDPGDSGNLVMEVVGVDATFTPNVIVSPLGYERAWPRNAQYLAKIIKGQGGYPRVMRFADFKERLEYARSIKNLESLPQGLGLKYLVLIRGEGSDLVAKAWKLNRPDTLAAGEYLICF